VADSDCDLFPFQRGDGPAQMAADEALLEYAAGGRPALRFYTWDPPTLSLGYFQPAADRLADPKLAALPYVRRASGGGAIVHHHELTYALALPPGPPWQAGANWVCRMHDIIRAALGAFGGAAAACGCGQEAGRGAFLCFAHQTPGDAILDGHKVVGSAQRKRVGALLQHGSILLVASPHAPHLAGVRELTGVATDPAALAGELARAFTRMTGWALAPMDWPAAVRDRVAALAAEKYRQPAWNDRR
jgi:lipoyl(octanoyl) transferase